MEETVLKAQPRDVVGKQVKALRRAGRLPAVIYGRSSAPILITLDMHDASRTLPTITTSHLVTVDLEGTPHTTLVREKQRHQITGHLVHVDFLEVSLTEKLRTSVVIVLEGDAPAIKNNNGVVVTGIESLEVECLPRDLPERIVVDLTGLKEIGDAIYVRDVPRPANVEVLDDPNEMVALVTAPVLEAEIEEGGAGGAEPEVIERGKKEEDAA